MPFTKICQKIFLLYGRWAAGKVQWTQKQKWCFFRSCYPTGHWSPWRSGILSHQLIQKPSDSIDCTVFVYLHSTSTGNTNSNSCTSQNCASIWAKATNPFNSKPDPVGVILIIKGYNSVHNITVSLLESWKAAVALGTVHNSQSYRTHYLF